MDLTGNGGVASKLHRELGFALGAGTDLVGVSEHFSEGNIGFDHSESLFCKVSDDHTASFVECTEDGSREFFGCFDNDLHDRLKDDRLSFAVGFTEAGASGDLERHIRRVDGVVLPIVDTSADTDDGEADEVSALKGGLEAFVAGGLEFFGDDTTHDVVDEFVWDALFARFDITSNTCVLTGTTRLFFVGVVKVGAFGDGFAVSDLGLTDKDFNAVFAFDAFDVDFEVEFTHPTDDGLAGFFVAEKAEGRVFFGEAVECFSKVCETFFVFGFDGKGDHGVRNEHRGHGVHDFAIRESVTRRAFNSKECHDVAGFCELDIVHLVGVHENKAADFVLVAVATVEDGIAFSDASLVNAAVGKLSETPVFEFKGEHHERLFGVWEEVNLCFVVFLVEGLVLHLKGVGEKFTNLVEQGLNGFVFVSGSEAHRRKLARESGFGHDGDDVFFGDLVAFAIEVHHGDLIIEVREGFDHGVALFFADRHEVIGDGEFFDDLAVFALADVGDHADEVDDAAMGGFESDGVLDQHGVVVEIVTKLLANAEGVCASAVAFVDEGDRGDAIATHLSVDGDGLGLDTCDGTKHEDGTVKNTEGAFDFDGEVDVAGSVDDVDGVLGGFVGFVVSEIPVDVGCGRLNGDAFFTFEIHRVHFGPDAVFSAHFMDGVDASCIKEDALCERGFSRVDVCGYSDVSEKGQVFNACTHCLVLVDRCLREIAMSPKRLGGVDVTKAVLAEILWSGALGLPKVAASVAGCRRNFKRIVLPHTESFLSRAAVVRWSGSLGSVATRK